MGQDEGFFKGDLRRTGSNHDDEFSNMSMTKAASIISATEEEKILLKVNSIVKFVQENNETWH